MSTRTVDSPIGPLRLEVSDARLNAVVFVDADAPVVGDSSSSPADEQVLGLAATQLAEYFAGERRDFDLPLTVLAGTTFQHQVWGHLRRIAYGETSSYGRLAGALGLTGHGSRAVGGANGRNPLPVVVPCHRVIGADGSITGYAGGVARKQWLLAHERGEAPAPLG
ncbi:methylated-DNA--[protein]-cysteine S-methyltransferase [Nocardioidaceae bacterium]|nr:methylated-DNA--[protein]-cysteine S-methyltransferase [Nocardioidaceae bacterium]